MIPIQVLPDHSVFRSIELWHSLSRITEFSIQVRDVNGELNWLYRIKTPVVIGNAVTSHYLHTAPNL